MSIGNEMAYRRSARGKDATGSLVFDQERKQATDKGETAGRKAAKKKAIEKFPG